MSISAIESNYTRKHKCVISNLCMRSGHCSHSNQEPGHPPCPFGRVYRPPCLNCKCAMTVFMIATTYVHRSFSSSPQGNASQRIGSRAPALLRIQRRWFCCFGLAGSDSMRGHRGTTRRLHIPATSGIPLLTYHSELFVQQDLPVYHPRPHTCTVGHRLGPHATVRDRGR